MSDGDFDKLFNGDNDDSRVGLGTGGFDMPTEYSDEELSEEELAMLAEGFAALGGESDSIMEQEDIDTLLSRMMQEDEDEEEEYNQQKEQQVARAEGEDAPGVMLDFEPEVYTGDLASQEIDVSIFKRPEKFSLKAMILFGIAQFKQAKGKDKIAIAAIGGLSAFVVIGVLLVGVFAVIWAFSDNEPTAQVLALDIPGHGFNNANHIFVDDAIYIGGELLVLSRILLDEGATVFYFNDHGMPGRYVFEMVGDDDRLYSRNIAFPHNISRERANNQYIVRFESVDREGDGFGLYITDLFTQDRVGVYFSYDPATINAGRYFEEPVDIHVADDLYFSIHHALFSGAGSTIGFIIRHDEGIGTLYFNPPMHQSPISLRHLGSFVPPVVPDVRQYDFDGLSLLRMDFSPLRTLHGSADVVFDNMYRVFGHTGIIHAHSLFIPGEDREQTLEFGTSFTVTLEGMQLQGPVYVLPLHGLFWHGDNYEGDDDDEGAPYTRIATSLDISLMGINDDGVFRVPGRVMFDARGTDVIFDTRGYEEILEFALDELYLDIESVLFRVPPVSVSLELAQGMFFPDEELQSIEGLISTAFHNQNSGIADYTAQVSQLYMSGGQVYAVVIEHVGEVVSELRVVTENVYRVRGTLQNEVLSITEVVLDSSRILGE